MTTTTPRVWLLAMALALACVLLVRSADAAEYGCNPATDKTCKPEGMGVVLPGGGIDLDGDGDEDELPQFEPHLTILGHARE
ncbi:hypothetical protein BDA96_04G078200 [Sorghum bicolor]|uniref:Uncharacterized protein n=2 Tax=Sorghum bicolor TaxID=4558 RepID=A0A921UHD0_SORBI|nr:uncharacterized protein LOC8079434 [Sorghum bicolor]KAG0532092.1 hypothetical protein BDA96_04G078200 [Sorghum bicolor]KXG29659.1 hypothetical protein SORBI_3004G071900 [Sorghum bicolor]|eukprot:XP_002453437.2 uncharacterized protein LOC8079434 [Sorghum bicolor]